MAELSALSRLQRLEGCGSFSRGCTPGYHMAGFQPGTKSERTANMQKWESRLVKVALSL
ncbi:MAG: hypothetical protein JWR19_868, partial [Pedosphaera sp.]|nr:hypothetical protein [Pedosphaera sp.]